jgi:hypothetical protein
MDLINVYLMSGNVAKEIQSLCSFSCLKIIKIEPPNKVQSIFSKRDGFSAHKTSLSISFTSVIRME